MNSELSKKIGGKNKMVFVKKTVMLHPDLRSMAADRHLIPDDTLLVSYLNS